MVDEILPTNFKIILHYMSSPALCTEYFFDIDKTEICEDEQNIETLFKSGVFGLAIKDPIHLVNN